MPGKIIVRGFPSTRVTVQLLEERGPVWEIKTEQVYQLSNQFSFLPWESRTTQGSLMEISISLEGAARIPRATPVVQHGHLRSQSPSSPSGLGAVPLLLSGHTWGGEVLSGSLGHSGQVTCIYSISSCWSYFQLNSWTFLDPLRSQTMTDSNSYQFCTSPSLSFSHVGVSLPPELGLDY